MKHYIVRGVPLLLLGLLFVHHSCQKTPEPIVEGQVLEYGTNTPISGAEVVLDACGGTVLGPISCATIATTQSAADGSYTMPKDKSAGALVANASKIGYFTDDESQIGGLDKPVNNIYLKPHAWIKATIKNVSGKYGFGSPDLIGGNIHQLKGEKTTITILVKGNQEYKLLFYILLDELTTAVSPEGVFIYDSKNNLLSLTGESYFKSIFTPIGHDTTNITIIY